MVYRRKHAPNHTDIKSASHKKSYSLEEAHRSFGHPGPAANELNNLSIDDPEIFSHEARAFDVASDSNPTPDFDMASDSNTASDLIEVVSSPAFMSGSHFNVSLSTSTLYNRAWAKFVSFDRRLAGRTITGTPLPVISIRFSVFSNKKSLFRLAGTPLILPGTVCAIEELLTSFVVGWDTDKEKGRDKRAQRVNEIFTSRPNFDETRFTFSDLVALFERGVPDATFLVKHPRLELRMRSNMAIVDFWRLWSQEPDFPHRSSEDWHADPLRIIMNPSEAERNLKLFSKPSAINKKKA